MEADDSDEQVAGTGGGLESGSPEATAGVIEWLFMREQMHGTPLN